MTCTYKVYRDFTIMKIITVDSVVVLCILSFRDVIIIVCNMNVTGNELLHQYSSDKDCEY